jgi:hypothetical protein
MLPILQTEFGSELVDLSAPLGAWNLKGKRPYLWAERLAKRLRSKAVELRVDVLACVTRHWLRDDNWFNIYGWWPDDQDPPGAIFSCAGFDDLAPERAATDRAIANSRVSALTGSFANVGYHTRGPKQCPLYFNQERSLERLTGAQAFDRPCRKKLVRTIRKELPALDALLAAFVAAPDGTS